MSTVIDHLNGVLADAVVFYYKLHNYHWFVKGPKFFTLHAQFEKMYDAWAEHVDDTAERILQLGGKPQPTLAAALQASAIAEENAPDAKAMVNNTITDLHTQRERILATIKAADATGDRPTCNILDGVNDAIEKTIWMLEAHNAG